MGNSVIKLEQVRMECAADGDVAPVIASGGSEFLPFVSICYQVQVAMLDGGPVVQTMGWKWNRGYFATFFTNSFQSDYAANNLTIAWLERCKGYDYNNTAIPKPDIDVLVRRDLVDTFRQYWGPANICWLYNSQLQYGVWGGTALSNLHGLTNPGASVAYTNPVGNQGAVINPINQVKDANGNYWQVTTYGTCGTFNPFTLNITATSVTSNVLTVTCANNVTVGMSLALSGTAESYLNGQTFVVTGVGGSAPNQTSFTAAFTHANFSNASDTGTAQIVPAFPTITSPSTVATAVTDGTVVWSAINPSGQGYRISPSPPQSGRVWLVTPIGQLKPVQYASLESYITPIPDEMYSYFLDGVKAKLLQNNKDPKIRKRGQDAWTQWMQSLDNSVRKGNLEPDDFMFLPPGQIMSPIGGYGGPRPDFPLSGGGIPAFWY